MTKGQIVNREIFYFLSFLLGIFIILEIIWPNIVIIYFNLNWLLILWLVAGLFRLIKK